MFMLNVLRFVHIVFSCFQVALVIDLQSVFATDSRYVGISYIRINRCIAEVL